MAGAPDEDERARMYSVSAALYALVGVLTGLLIAGVALAIGGLVRDDLAGDVRAGGAGLGALTALGIAVSVNLDALRARRLFVRAAKLELAAVAIYLAVMLALILGGADLALVISANGLLPLLSGVLSALAARRMGLGLRLVRGSSTQGRRAAIVPTAGWLLVVELSNLAMYGSSRIILGAHRPTAAVGVFEGPVRAHNLLYAAGGALAVPVIPTASRYAAEAESGRLGQLAVRGTRYTLALFVPVCVTLIVLAEPLLGVWLGAEYTGGQTALAILVSYWILYGGLVVTPGFLVGAGRAREVALVLATAALANLVLALVLTPELGLEGPALATAIPMVVAYPLLLRQGLRASGAELGELVRRALAPNYVLGAVLAGILLSARELLEPDSLAAVLGLALAGLALYWAVYYALVLEVSERRLARGLVGGRG
jgi:O-antigen/teichoic acid export membrane protein